MASIVGKCQASTDLKRIITKVYLQYMKMKITFCSEKNRKSICKVTGKKGKLRSAEWQRLICKKCWKQTCPVWPCSVSAFFQVDTDLAMLKDFMGFYKLVKGAFLPPFPNKPGPTFHYSLSLSIFPSFGLFCGFCLVKLSFPSSFPQRLSSSFSFPSWAPWNAYNLCHVHTEEMYESWLTLACQTFYKHMAKICLWSPKLQWTFSLVKQNAYHKFMKCEN